MSTTTTSELVGLARREAFEEAAQIVDRMAKKIFREADKRHNADPPEYDAFEELEGQASALYSAAAKIRQKAKRP